MNCLDTIYTMNAILRDNNIPFIMNKLYDGDGYRVSFDWIDGDVICHSTIPNGRVESIGFPWDEDSTTRLSPEYMAARIVGCFMFHKGHTFNEQNEEEL